MNSIERVFAAISGEKPDRVPVSLTTSLYGARLLNCSTKEYYHRADLYAEGQMLVAEQCKTDVIFSPFAFAMVAEVFGAKPLYRDMAPPVSKNSLQYTPGDKIHLNIEQLLNHPISQYLVESVKLLSENLGKEKVIVGLNISPCDLPATIFGIEKWLHTLLFFPQAATDIIQLLGEYFVSMNKQMLNAGAHAIACPINFTNPQIVTPAITQMILPLITNIFEGAGGPRIIHHGGPDMEGAIQNFANLPGCAVFVISARDSIKNIRIHLPEKTILGNIDGPFLQKYSEETIRNKCTKILAENEGNYRFILGTSNADITFDTPVEKMLSIVRVAEENVY